MIVGNGIGVSIDLSKSTLQRVVATGGQTTITVTAFFLRTNGFFIVINGGVQSASTYNFSGQIITFTFQLSYFDEVLIIPIS